MYVRLLRFGALLVSDTRKTEYRFVQNSTPLFLWSTYVLCEKARRCSKSCFAVRRITCAELAATEKPFRSQGRTERLTMSLLDLSMISKLDILPILRSEYRTYRLRSKDTESIRKAMEISDGTVRKWI
jgi:hypothetical protein